MDAEDFLAIIVWTLPFLALAGLFYAIAAWKKTKGRGLHGQAQQQLSDGNHLEARDLLLQALWNANEEPWLEHEILSDLSRLYEIRGISFSAADYQVLIGQFERLSTKGSHKAISEIKKVQLLKRQLIDRMPEIS